MPGRNVFAWLCLVLPFALAVSAAEIGREPVVTSVQFSDRGDCLFRTAQFEDAEAAYLQAIELDRRNIRAQLGVERIADMMSARSETHASSCIGYRRALRIGRLLLMQGGVDGRVQGYFIIDSGSLCSLVSRASLCSTTGHG